MSPLCESYVPKEKLNQMEPFYPLHAYVCERCFLVQLDDYVTRESIFSEYAYFSSYSDSWVEHMRRYADAITERLGLGTEREGGTCHRTTSTSFDVSRTRTTRRTWTCSTS